MSKTRSKPSTWLRKMTSQHEKNQAKKPEIQKLQKQNTRPYLYHKKILIKKKEEQTCCLEKCWQSPCRFKKKMIIEFSIKDILKNRNKSKIAQINISTLHAALQKNVYLALAHTQSQQSFVYPRPMRLPITAKYSLWPHWFKIIKQLLNVSSFEFFRNYFIPRSAVTRLCHNPRLIHKRLIAYHRHRSLGDQGWQVSSRSSHCVIPVYGCRCHKLIDRTSCKSRKGGSTIFCNLHSVVHTQP